jgi:hypothetical protein
MRYKNISGEDLSVIGVGIVHADAEIETDFVINNPNFVLVKESKAEPKPKTAEDKPIQ